MAGFPNTVLLRKETFGSPKFPSYPYEYMPWSKTPVVSWILAIAYSGLLPSAQYKASAFSAKADYPMSTTIHFS